jgi:hypothetical protein
MGATPKGGLRADARPGGKELLGKNHEAASISWARRAMEMRNVECGMRNEKKTKKFRIPHSEFRIWHARSARRILRKPVEASKERASPADAFCPETPCPRATTQASRKFQTLIDPPAEPGVYLKEIMVVQVDLAEIVFFFGSPRKRDFHWPAEGEVKGYRLIPGSWPRLTDFFFF